MRERCSESDKEREGEKIEHVSENCQSTVKSLGYYFKLLRPNSVSGAKYIFIIT